ncbi:unnamed protein product [Vitrella brassicaformis CCMP3155]|uniref:Casein kinase II subunit beta n=2 Tax=Vitrella brassicaformis TaxID=1169539 RepID=A0A0G4FC34_VITBC|nr:unnamed protein product [Vitrella brassicaformis CCMP3155]|mmetsp:Transcript_11660/g.33957  ORF Transcript_11660/g.33957 Transcript_11660/m.33957 type:complete len:354 (+) Transcript_11660:129-1190(+)|eukprot:CEM10162.1 unnamed protein product [Vitrella brassicaformis CCMP3155]
MSLYTYDRHGIDEEDDDDECSEAGWIQWFCSLEGHDFFVEVDEDYIKDNFNLYGLRPRVNNYDKALDMILAPEAPDDDDLVDPDFVEVYRCATDLYGLIHQRFITSPRGLTLMKEKFLKGGFGYCPRVLCERQNALPIGLSEELRSSRVKTYCPKCQEVYTPKASKVGEDMDGAYFGTSFPHIFLQTYANLVPLDFPTPFVPKIFGFRVHGKKSLVQEKLEHGEYGTPEATSSSSAAPPPHQTDQPSSSAQRPQPSAAPRDDEAAGARQRGEDLERRGRSNGRPRRGRGGMSSNNSEEGQDGGGRRGGKPRRNEQMEEDMGGELFGPPVSLQFNQGASGAGGRKGKDPVVLSD